ncbi:MAG: rRNA maturation RNase YbeY [Planctomycetota bacterium]|nr:MAG: rRNA maturation RNase YbeY [Planctomycetota bacterium]
MLTIELCDRQQALAFDAARLKSAVASVLGDAGYDEGAISIAIVDDDEIHELNRRYLSHDYATDVLSFVLEQEAGRIEGEIIASADTAARCAGEFGWAAEDELLLYVVHGALHLAGHDDADDTPRAAMREAERRYLAGFGVAPPADEAAPERRAGSADS